MWVQSSHREGRNERLGFASRRRHLLPHPPPNPAPPLLRGGGHSFPPGGGYGSSAESLQCSKQDAGRRGCGKREEWGADGEAAVAARSRRFPVPRKLSTAAAAAAGSAHVSPPAPAPSSVWLTPPPPPALSSSFPQAVSPAASFPPPPLRRFARPANPGCGGLDVCTRVLFHLHAERPWVSF